MTDDLHQVGVGGFRWQSAQAVVAAEFDQQDVHWAPQQPVHAAESAGGGVTANPGVDHGERQFCLVNPLLKEGGKGFRRVESIAGGNGIAKHQQGLARSRFGSLKAVIVQR